MPFNVYLLYLFSYFIRLPQRIPLLGAMRFDLILVVVLFFLLWGQQVRDLNGKKLEPQRRLEVFIFYVFISLPLVTWPGSALNVGMEPWIKVLLFFFFTIKAIQTEKQFKIAIWFFVVCQVFRVLEPTYLHMTEGYWGSIAYAKHGVSYLNRLAGSPHDVVNPTQLSWVAVTAMPFLFYLGWQGKRIGKIFVACITPPFLYGFLLTGARGGMVCVAIVILGIVWFSENRMRNTVLTAVLVMAVGTFMVARMDSGLKDRYVSLVDSSVTGAGTVQGRFNALERYLKTLTYRPILGNGLGTSREVNWNVSGNSNQITHNLYLEIAQELGLMGLAFFLAYIVSMYKIMKTSYQRLCEMGMKESWLGRVVRALIVWFAMDLVYSMSVFGLRSWEWYLFGGFAVITYRFTEKLAIEASPELLKKPVPQRTLSTKAQINV